MNKVAICVISLLLIAAPTMAASPASEQYINQIAGGDSLSLTKASRSIYQSEFKEQEVLDVLAEKLLLSYNDGGKTRFDSIAWACKALGRSGDIRYKNVLQTVKENATNRKIKKYAKESLKMMPDGEANESYEKGTVDLISIRENILNNLPGIPKLEKNYTKLLCHEFKATPKIMDSYSKHINVMQESMISELNNKKLFNSVEMVASEQGTDDSLLIIKADITYFNIVGFFKRGVNMWSRSKIELDLLFIDGDTNEVVRKERMSSSKNFMKAYMSFTGTDRSLPNDMGKMLAEYIAQSKQ